MPEVICLDCKKIFKIWPYRIGKAKYCSYQCARKNWKCPDNAVKFKKGQKPWSTGRGIYKDCIICKKNFYVWLAHSERVKCCSKKCGYKLRDLSGKKNPMYGKKGELSPKWKGGITSERARLYNQLEYREWRKAVFKRDSFICQICNQKGGLLNADHIKPWKLYPNLRYKISNGRTLCFRCHTQTDTYGRRVFNYAS